MNIRLSMWGLSLATALAVVGCHSPGGYNLPPAERLLHPGPGVTGPGPGVTMYPGPMGPGPSVVAGMNAGVVGPMDAGQMGPAEAPVSQVQFAKPEGMQVRWSVTDASQFDSIPLTVPGRHNFPQGGIYRLKLTDIPGREGVELYPTLEIGPTTPRTEAFLAHNAIPVQFTEQDFDQVLTGNFVTKVIYLPDREFQEMALAGVETLVSTRLDPGIDPISEADRRGAILGIVRLGNIDPELGDGQDEQLSVVPASYGAGSATAGPVAGAIDQSGGMVVPPGYVSGVTAPQFGMPITGTPIGLPGPPHVPLGGPAGLRRHVIKNHTAMHLPQPTKKLRIDVKQKPGFSYPQPSHKATIHEQTIHPSPWYHRPFGNWFQLVPDAAPARPTY